MFCGSIRLLNRPRACISEPSRPAQTETSSSGPASGSNRTINFHDVPAGRGPPSSQLKNAFGPPISRHHVPWTVPGDTSQVSELPALAPGEARLASADPEGPRGADGTVGAGPE